MRISDWSSDVCSSDLPDDTNIDFLKWRKLASFMSFILVVISIALVAVRGLNLVVDFVGGQSVHVEFTENMPEIEDVREAVGKIGLGEATIPYRKSTRLNSRQ